MKNVQRGFSLVEISVVLVIIALIASAATVGVNMIEAAKIRAIVSEFGKYTVAINSFSAKHEQFPGDFSEAEDNWGASNTDNGNNDGHIQFENSDGVHEGYLAWQHLSFEKMLNATYPGTRGDGIAVVGTDVPLSTSKGGYFLDYAAFGFSEANVLILGKAANSTAGVVVAGVLTPSQALEVDVKMDDGEPKTGTVRGADGSGATAENCINLNGNGAGSDDFYNIALKGADCTIAVKMALQ